MYENSLKTTVS